MAWLTFGDDGQPAPAGAHSHNHQQPGKGRHGGQAPGGKHNVSGFAEGRSVGAGGKQHGRGARPMPADAHNGVHRRSSGPATRDTQLNARYQRGGELGGAGSKRPGSSKPEAAPARKRHAAEDGDQYRRALARMEMGPEDDMSDLSDLSEEEGQEPLVPGPSGRRLVEGTRSKHRNDGYDFDREESEQEGSEDGAGDGEASGSGGEEGSGSEDDDSLGEEGVDSEDSGDEPQEIKRLPTGRPQAVQQNSDSQGEEEDEDQADDDEEEEEEGSEDEEGQAALAQLAELPLGQRLQLLQDGSGPQGELARQAARDARVQEKSFKRANKHRPQEMSSKRPVSRFREVLPSTRKAGKDPRFAPMRSDNEKEAAARRYAFLYDDVLPRERAAVKAALKAAKKPGDVKTLGAQLQRLDQALGREKQRRVRSEVEHQFKAQQRTAVEGGSKPFFLKASDKRKLELVAKYKELSASGQLDRYMEKRRKRNASKDHKYIPTGRRGGE